MKKLYGLGAKLYITNFSVSKSALWGGGSKGVLAWSPKDLLNKNVSFYRKIYVSKAKMTS
jgi:hypothetical protein